MLIHEYQNTSFMIVDEALQCAVHRPCHLSLLPFNRLTKQSVLWLTMCVCKCISPLKSVHSSVQPQTTVRFEFFKQIKVIDFRANPHRCSHLFLLIRPLRSLKIGTAMLRIQQVLETTKYVVCNCKKQIAISCLTVQLFVDKNQSHKYYGSKRA